MMDLVPVMVDGVVVLNAANVCTACHFNCRLCPELAVGVHNWLVENEMGYLLLDFQDEKDICHTLLVELLQLRKRQRIPFLFAGVMARPRALLESYAFTQYPFFLTPEDAIAYLKEHHSPLVKSEKFGSVRFGEPIPCNRSRQNRGEVVDAAEESEIED